MFDYGHGIVGYVLTLISLIHGLIACVISLTVVIIIIGYKHQNRLKREGKITLLLSANIYVIIFIYTSILVSFNIQTLIGDAYGNNFNSTSCTFGGYSICVMCCAIYQGFIIQALFRLFRIVYFNYRWLQLYWFYIIAIPIQLVGAIILLCPILIWHDVIYISNDRYCFVSIAITRTTLWAVFACYGLPLIYLSLIYMRIILFIRQQDRTLSLAIRRRQQRDLLAIKRIVINIGLLISIGAPAIVFIFMRFITGIVHPLTYRTTFMGGEISMAVLCIEMVIMTPQLKTVVMRKRQTRITALEGSVQMRTITNTH